MIMNAANTNADDPAASPSSPSVRFTALAVAYTTRIANTNQPAVPRLVASGRVNDRCVDVCAKSSASHANTAATATMPSVLPRLRKPEVAAGAHAEIVVEEADRAEPDDQREQRPARGRERDASGAARARPRSRSTVAPTIAMPPMVGVPGLGDVRVRDRPVVADLLADPARAAAGG